MTNSLSPFVYWAQTDIKVTLKVDVKDTKNAVISMDDKAVYFSADGCGAQGFHHYQFRLKLYENIDTTKSEYKIFPSHVTISLQKERSQFWPRLISALSKPPWLKIDFDKWVSNDGSTEIEENVPDIIDEYPDIYDNLQKEEKGYRTESFKKVYLVLYNLFQFVGFLYILIAMALRFAEDGAHGIPEAYKNVGTAMKLCTLFQWLEVCHALFGYTRNSVLTCFTQAVGRSVVLFGLIELEERMHTKPVVFYLFIVWSSLELIRYPFYITQLNNFEIRLLTWLRYTVWIPLYPLGFICEGVIYLRNIPYYEETGRLSIAMPNKWNFTFNVPTLIKIYLIFIFIPGMYQVINHMQRERSKKLTTKRIKFTKVR